MNKIIYFFTMLSISIIMNTKANAQATGNADYNDNNRFNQNSNYKQESKKRKNNSAVDFQNNFQQTAQQAGYQALSGHYGNEYFLNVNILYNAKPSAYTAIFHINQAGKKINELDSLLNYRVNKLINAAKKIGIDASQFNLDMIALVPIFEKERRHFSKSYIQIPKGFEIQKNLHIKYDKASQLDKLFSLAAQSEIYDLIKVEYHYDSLEIALQSIQNKAILLSNKKIENLKKLNINLDTTYRTIAEWKDIYFPIDKYTSYKPLSISSLDENTESNSTDKNIAQPYRSTIFYNPTNIDGFDAVLNTNHLEPTIQIVYTMQIKFRIGQSIKTITNTKIEKETEILILGQNGEIKTLKR